MAQMNIGTLIIIVFPFSLNVPVKSVLDLDVL